MILMARAMAAKLQNCSGDIFATWAVGGTVAMAPRMLFFASLGWAIQHLEVTHLTCTPSLWQSLELLNRKYPKGWMAFGRKRWRAHAQDLRPAANRQHGLTQGAVVIDGCQKVGQFEIGWPGVDDCRVGWTPRTGPCLSSSSSQTPLSKLLRALGRF